MKWKKVIRSGSNLQEGGSVAPDWSGAVRSSIDTGKELDWFFAGQVNHDSRRECVETLRGLSDGKLVETGGSPRA
jgi:hypothetical protein